jgi:hypothetical protein
VERTATPSLRTLIAGALEQRLAGVRVALPGQVVAYDADRQAVDVQPLVADGLVDEDGARMAEPLPVLVDVPLVFPGAGAYRITWPVEVGAVVLLVIASSSIARWKVGAGGEVSDPGSDHRHHLEDAIAIPGLHAFGAPPTEAPTDALVVHGAAIRLGSPEADDPVVRRSDLAAVVGDVNNRLTNHTHTGVTTGSGVSGNGTAVTITTPACSPVVSAD